MARRFLFSKVTLPFAALRMPMIVFMSVVLPAPLRPMSPVIEAGAISIETSRRICVPAMETLTRSSLSTGARDVALHFGIAERDLRRRVGDDATVVEGEHTLREAAHDFHVVLDEKHRRALGAHGLEHHLHDAKLLLR